MKPYTDVTILMDRSGSMHSIKEAMETAMNEFVTKHKENPTTRLTFIQFDDRDDFDVQFKGLPISNVDRIRLQPRGNTPLLDAMCKAIDSTGRRLADIPQNDRPDQVLMVVVTDGAENASTRYNRGDVKSRIEQQNEKYGWQFIYLGANQDSFKEAASMGIKQNWAINYAATPGGVTGMSNSLIGNTVSYTSSVGGMRGQSVKGFTKEQRKEAEDKTNSTT